MDESVEACGRAERVRHRSAHHTPHTCVLAQCGTDEKRSNEGWLKGEGVSSELTERQPMGDAKDASGSRWHDRLPSMKNGAGGWGCIPLHEDMRVGGRGWGPQQHINNQCTRSVFYESFRAYAIEEGGVIWCLF